MGDDEQVAPPGAPPDGEPRSRRRRRAVGPPGAVPAERGGAGLDLDGGRPAAVPEDDDERFLRDVPPHHGR